MVEGTPSAPHVSLRDQLTKAVVLLSGGQDSTTACAWARQKFKEVHAVTFDYRQRHSRELSAASEVSRILDVDSHEIIEVGPILDGRSPLTDPDAELEQYADFEEMDQVIGDRIEVTFVPMRNALFLTLAANRAICKDIYDIVGGMCQMDRTNYPDCRPAFMRAQENMMDRALGLDAVLGPRMRIHTPLMSMSKAASILLATQIPGAYAALAYTHTAYDNAFPPTGKDHATVLRAHGFEEAGLPDPLIMRAVKRRLMPLPDTTNYNVEAVAKYDHLCGTT